MGVQGLWDLLAPVGRRVSVETLAGKRLAIDASIWMVQFIKAMRDERGDMVSNAHLLGFFRRICKLLFLRTKPVFVFDGRTPALKRRTVFARRMQRENAQTNIRKTAEKLLLNQLKKMRLKELEKELEKQKIKNHGKGKNVVLSEPCPSEINDARPGCLTREEVDEVMAASLGPEERDTHNAGASTSSNSLHGQDGGPAASSFMDDAERNDARAGYLAQEKIDEMLAASLAAEERNTRNIGASTSSNALHGQGGGPSVSSFMDDARRNDAHAGCLTQEKIDEMLAASLAAEERDTHNTGASTSSSALHGQDGGPSTSSFMDDVEEDEDDEEMILPMTDGKIDPTVLAALPPSMQLDLLVQMRERLMAENRQKYQKVKKAPQEFSELQIETYLKTVAFRREIDEVQKAAAGKGVGGLQTARIASEANKEFIFSSSFTGDKHVLASAGMKKTAENQDGSELVHSFTQPTTLASALTSTAGSVPSGDKAPTSSGNETMRDFSSDVQTYRDERGLMRVSRVRAMGIRMTRDLQRNLDLMKEMEQDIISAGLPVNVPVNPAEENVGNSKLISEIFPEFSGERSSITTEKQDKNRPTTTIETSLEISFEDDAQCKPVDNDDDFFVRLVAGDPDPINSVGDSVSKDPNLESGSDCEWEEGNTGMQIENVKSAAKTSQLEENNDDETELLWEDGVSNNPEDASLCPAVSVKTKPRGSIEEDAALQEAIRRSLEGLEGERDASYNLERGKKVVHSMSEVPPEQDKEIGVPKIGSSDRSVSVTALLNDMAENKSSDIVYSPDMILVVPADNACQSLDMVVDRPSENCVPSDVGCTSEFALSVSGQSAERQSNKAVGTTEKSYVVLSDAPCESSCNTSHSHVIDVTLADPLHLTFKKTSQTDGTVPPILHSNEAPGVAINLEKSEEPASDAGISRIVSEEKPIHGVDERENNEDDIIQVANLEDEFQVLDEEYEYLEDERKKLERNADSVNNEMIVECQELLQMFGLPFVIAPMEAEAQCAYMELAGLVEGVVTDDSDVFLFGARSVYKNIFDDRKYVETYLMKDMENELGLTREKLVHMALLLGSDYTEGVSGIGIVNAIEVVNAFPEEDGLSKFREWVESPDPTILGLSGMTPGSSSKKKVSKSSDTLMNVAKDGMNVTSSDCNDHGKTEDRHELENVPKITQIFMDKHRKVSKNWHIPSSFPSQAVISAYASPQVDKSTDPCSWGKPDLFALRRLCWEKFGWAGQKADDLLLPVLKEYNKRETQLRLESFYTFSERFAKIRSKRINQAVKGITGNQSFKSSNDPKVGGKRNKRKNPVKNDTVCGEENLANLPKKSRKSNTRKENFPSEKEQTSESVLEMETGSCADPRATARGKRNTQAGGRRKMKGIADIKFSDAAISDDDEELQIQKLEVSERVRRSTRSKKAAKYAESEDEIDLTTQPMCDATEEQKHRDQDIDDSVCFSEMEQCTPGVSVPDGGLCGDHLLKGGGFCADEDEPVNETGRLQDDSAPVEIDRHYLQTGGGFCFDDSDADHDPQNRTSEEIEGTLRETEDNSGEMGSSTLPKPALDSVADIQCSNLSGNDTANGSPSEPGKVMLEVKDNTNSPMKALSAMPNLRRKRKKSS